MRDSSIEEDRLDSTALDEKIGTDRRRVARIVATLVALVVFVLTAGLPAGIFVAVGSFGFQDVRTALRILRFDPDRTRGRACVWFYLTHACTCIFMASLPLLCLNAIIARTGVSISVEEIVIFVMFVSSFLGVILTAWIGVGLALFHERQVWIEPEFRLSWAAKVGPPGMATVWPPILPGYWNHGDFARWIVKTTIESFLVGGPISAVGLILSLLGLGDFEVWQRWSLAVVSVISAFLGPLALSKSFWKRLNRIVASNPRECYPELAP